MEGEKKKKIDIHLPPTCFSRRKTAFWQIYKMQLFLTIYTFIFQSGIKVLIAVAEKHKPPRWEWRLADAAEKQPLCSPASQWIGKNRVTGEHLPQFWSSLFTVPRAEGGRGMVVWGPA